MNNSRTKRLFSRNGQVLSLAVVLVVLTALFSIFSGSFFTGPNLINILRQVSFVGIAAIGATMVLLIGGIDLSIGSVAALAGVSGASLMAATGIPPFLCILIGVAVGALCGGVNGLVVTRFRIPALITTLATVTIFRGIAYTTVHGMPVFGLPQGRFLGFKEGVMALGKGYVWFIPVPVILMAITFVLGWIFLYRTYVGRYIYALGGNEEAARLSGIKTDRIQMVVYTLAGTLAGLTGMIMMARVNSGQPSIATGFELEVITAVVLGGVSIAGGRGNLIGVLLGVLITGVLNNGLIIMNVSEYNQMVIRGLVLLFAVGLDRLRERVAV